MRHSPDAATDDPPPRHPPFPTPPLGVTTELEILPAWTDLNGHMNVAYYVLAFDRATDALYDALGIGWGYLERERKSLFTLAMNVDYRREVFAGSRVRIESRLLDHDHKRIHYFHAMHARTRRHARGDERARGAARRHGRAPRFALRACDTESARGDAGGAGRAAAAGAGGPHARPAARVGSAGEGADLHAARRVPARVVGLARA